MNVAMEKSVANLCYGEHAVTVSIERIDRDIAANMLKMNTSNRKLSEFNVKKIRQAIRAGLFVFNGEPILISNRRIVINGQHRLEAVVREGKPIVCLVVRGLDHEQVFGHHDIGKSRSLADWLSIAGYANPVKLASAIGSLSALVNTANLYITVAPTIDEANALLSEYPELVWAAEARKKAPLCRPGTKMALSVLMRRIDASDEAAFWEGLESGVDLPQGSPLLAGRNRLMGHRKNERLMKYMEVGTLCVVWNKWRSGVETAPKTWLFRHDMDIPDLI